MKFLYRFFKKQEDRRVTLANFIRTFEEEAHYCEYAEDSGRDLKYVFNPKITERGEEAFTLNPAAVPIIKESANYYVNRVLIPTDIRIPELKKVMAEMRNNYLQNKFRYYNRVTHVSFTMPGYDNTVRVSETDPSMFEIRYCAKGYPNEN